MINASKEFRDMVYGNGNKLYVGKANIELADGTVLEITASDIWESGIQISEQTSNSSSFDIGFCACNQLVFKINNIRDKYSAYDFNNAVTQPYIGLQLSETVEYLKKGVYTVDLSEQVGSYISLTCMDNMHKLDKKITSLSGSTAGLLVNNICIACGVMLKTASFDGHNMSFALPNNYTDYTYRQMLSFICQATGTFARFDGNGLLEIKWYDTGAFESSDSLNGGVFDNTTKTSYQTGDIADGGDFTFSETANYDGGTFLDMKRYHHIYRFQNLKVATDDVVITGIKVTNEDVSYLYGSEEYALEIQDNPLTTGREQEIATYLGNGIIGVRFRPLSLSGRSNPLIEAGDPAYVTDRKNNTYQCYITNYNFTIRQYMNISCDAASPQANSADGLDSKTETIRQARKVAKQELTTYDLTAQQLTNLITGGFGLFKSEVEDTNGGKIYYMHDQPTLEESSVRWFMTSEGMLEQKKVNGIWTTVAGTDKEGNALFNVLTAKGINAEWINVGTLRGIRVEATEGTIANMDIGQYGLSKTYTDAQDTYTGELSLQNKGFNLSFYNLLNTIGAGINVYYNDENEPILNLYARNENGLDNSNILFNGVAFLDNITSLQTRISKMENFLITNMGYEG